VIRDSCFKQREAKATGYPEYHMREMIPAHILMEGRFGIPPFSDQCPNDSE
jgi:hypothetical protein